MSTPGTLSLAIKWPKLEADHIHLSNSEDKIAYSSNDVLRCVVAWPAYLLCEHGDSVWQQHLAVSQFGTTVLACYGTSVSNTKNTFLCFDTT